MRCSELIIILADHIATYGDTKIKIDVCMNLLGENNIFTDIDTIQKDKKDNLILEVR